MRPRPEPTEVKQFASKAINLLKDEGISRQEAIETMYSQALVPTTDTHKLDSEDKTLYIKPLTIENVVDTHKLDSEDKTLYIKPLMIENVVDTHKLDSEDKTLYIKPLTKGCCYISVTGR